MNKPKQSWVFTVLAASFLLGFMVACGNRNQNPNTGVVAPGAGYVPGYNGVGGAGAPVATATGSHPEGIQITMQFISTGGAPVQPGIQIGMGAMQVVGQMMVTRNPTLGCQLPPGQYYLQSQSPVQIGTGYSVSDMVLIGTGPTQIQAYFTQAGLYSQSSGGQFYGGVPGATGQTLGLSGQLIIPSCMIPNFTIAP